MIEHYMLSEKCKNKEALTKYNVAFEGKHIYLCLPWSNLFYWE